MAALELLQQRAVQDEALLVPALRKLLAAQLQLCGERGPEASGSDDDEAALQGRSALPEL